MKNLKKKMPKNGENSQKWPKMVQNGMEKKSSPISNSSCIMMDNCGGMVETSNPWSFAPETSWLIIRYACAWKTLEESSIMTTSLRHARSIQQKLLSSKESIRSILSYNSYRKDDSICSDKELQQKLKQVDKELGRLLEYVKTLESKARRVKREEGLKKEGDK